MSHPKSLYGVHPGVVMTQKWVASLKERTGRSLDEWLALVKKSGPTTLNQQIEWLKEECELGTGETIVPLYRRHVFAQIKPTTQTRIDMGFALGASKAEGRLISTGGFAKKDRITHRIPISSPGDIDGEVKRWAPGGLRG